MTKQNIRLIVSDIDGTILDDQHQVDSQLREQIPLLKKENIPFVLASARSPRVVVVWSSPVRKAWC